jgi:hypothetical protein
VYCSKDKIYQILDNPGYAASLPHFKMSATVSDFKDFGEKSRPIEYWIIAD